MNWLDEKGRVIEPLFADYFLERHPMRCFHDRLFTVDGMIDDEAAIKKEIYERVRAYVQSNVARKIDQLLQTIKLSCASEPPEIHHLRDHQKSLGIIYDDKCIGTNRGFHNVDLNPFVPVDAPCPWD